MDVLKEKSLNDTYNEFMKIGLEGSDSSDILNEIVPNDIVGFGTAIDEKIFSRSGFRDLLKKQSEQSANLEMHWNITPAKHIISSSGNVAVFADDINVTITANNETIKMYFRFSVVFEYREDRWQVIHFHGSKPENVESEKDTFGIEEWKQKSIELEKIIAERTATLVIKNNELESAMANLKATQAQLIQSEKMASLGELTAGIAHEIQNPLNFVNNFSEVNKELIEEMKQEIEKGNMEEVKAIANDIADNEQKITQHGKRADAIVKGMLQHSRSSTGVKEPANINALADEYLRLAYHGLRAKDKSFNATMKTDFDESIGNINIIPQDIGRVILNLITNAFYAVTEKKQQHPDGYEPTVTVSTKMLIPPSGGTKGVKISVKDNGNGIPDSVLDKIYQPFFTTKPSGQGTGLGLSMSYEIITKLHGGELKVDTRAGEGAEFTIILPV